MMSIWSTASNSSLTAISSSHTAIVIFHEYSLFYTDYNKHNWQTQGNDVKRRFFVVKASTYFGFLFLLPVYNIHVILFIGNK